MAAASAAAQEERDALRSEMAAAAAVGREEREALAGVNSALEAAKSELEARVAAAAAALTAAEELKELRKRHRDEVARLNQVGAARGAGSNPDEQKRHAPCSVKSGRGWRCCKPHTPAPTSSLDTRVSLEPLPVNLERCHAMHAAFLTVCSLP